MMDMFLLQGMGNLVNGSKTYMETTSTTASIIKLLKTMTIYYLFLIILLQSKIRFTSKTTHMSMNIILNSIGLIP